MAAPGEDHQPLVRDIHDLGLVVCQVWFRRPAFGAERLVRRRHPRLEVRPAGDLPGQEEGILEQEGGVVCVDQLEAGAGQGRRRGRRQRENGAVGRRASPLRIGLAVGEQRQTALAEAPGEPFEAPGVVEVAVGEDDRLNVLRVQLEPVDVRHNPIGTNACIEEQPVRLTTHREGHERGETVLRGEGRVGVSVLDQRILHAHPGRPAHLLVAREERVDRVVDEHGDRHGIGGLERDGLHARSIRRGGRADNASASVR